MILVESTNMHCCEQPDIAVYNLVIGSYFHLIHFYSYSQYFLRVQYEIPSLYEPLISLFPVRDMKYTKFDL